MVINCGFAVCFTTMMMMMMICSSEIGGVLGATTYIVGNEDEYGWNENTNYDVWAADKIFHVGDSLVFNYHNDADHNVNEVTEMEYTLCTEGMNPISHDNSGSTTIQLKTTGKHYFRTSNVGLCDQGMKLSVHVCDIDVTAANIIGICVGI